VPKSGTKVGGGRHGARSAKRREVIPTEGKRLRNLDPGTYGRVPLNPYSPIPKKGVGCLACPILPTIKGVQIGNDYCGGRPPEITVDTHRVLGKGNLNPRVLVVLHNPSFKEDAEGKLGDNRELRDIKAAMSQAGIDYRKNVMFTYAVKCCAHGAACANTTAAKACAPFLSREIQKFNPEFIVPVGSTPLKMVCGPKYRIDTCHGSPFEQEVAGAKRKIMPVFTPGTLFYRDVLRPQWEKAWDDLAGLLEGRLTLGRGLGDYKEIVSAEKAAKMFDSYADQDVAFDFETNGLDPLDREMTVPQIKRREGNTFTLVSPRDAEYKERHEPAAVAIVSWSDKAGKGYYVLRDHVDGTWKAKDREVFDAAFKRFITRRSVRKVVHNGMFEQTWCRLFFKTRIVNLLDTMTIHHQVDEESPHSLDNVATQFTGMGNWKQPVTAVAETFSHNYRHIPKDIIGPYAGADADATFRLKDILLKKLDDKRKHLVVHYYPLMIDALSAMQVVGTHGDKEAAAFFSRYTALRSANALFDMKSLPVVRKYIRRKESEDPRRGKADQWEFNTNSPDQVKEILYGELGYEPLKYTDAAEEATGDEEDFDVSYGSSDKDSLNHFIRTKNCAFSAALLAFRRYDKQHGTYAVPYLEHIRRFDGYIRGNFKPTGTKTGRTSSAGPNLQNAPVVAKRVYTSRFGDDGCIFAADFSQIEVRVAASLAREKSLLDAYASGTDVHLLTMCRIFHLTMDQAKELEKSDPKKYKRQRTIAKRVVFGVLYGIGAPGIVNTLRQEGIIADEEEAQEYIDAFFRAYPAIRRYIDDTCDFIYENGYTLSPFGRRRHLPDIHSEDHGKVNRAKRQGPNAVIQSTASDMMVTAIILINKALRKKGYKSRLIMTVHDSIVLDCLRSEVAEVASLCLDIMENLPQRAAGVWGKGFDWSWLRCPIVAEGEIGLNWRDCVPYRPGAAEGSKVHGDATVAVKEAAALQHKEDRKARDVYLHAKLHQHRASITKVHQKFLDRVASVVKPDSSDGVPLEPNMRKELRALVKEYTDSPECNE